MNYRIECDTCHATHLVRGETDGEFISISDQDLADTCDCIIEGGDYSIIDEEGLEEEEFDEE